MKKLLILLILLFTPFLTDARGLMMMGGGVAAAGVTTACIGYPNSETACDYSTAPASGASTTADGTKIRRETGLTGTAHRLRFYALQCPGNGTIIAVYYVGTELRGTASITCTGAPAWLWSADFTSYSARSLSFSSGDNIRFGVSYDYGTQEFIPGRTVDAVTPNYYWGSTYSPDPDDTTTANYDLAVILEYTN
jgi:hypothetical protein